MKICDKCGAHNADNRMFCIDCDETLGDKLSAAEEEKARASVNGKIEKMCNERDPLYVSKFDKIMGSVSAVGAVLSLLLALASIFTQMDGKFLLCAVLFFLISTLEALVPQVTWAIEKFDNKFLRVLIGSTFDIKDIICYGVGCIGIWICHLMKKMQGDF